MKTLADPEARESLVRRLRTVRPDSGRRWGRMSSHQMICHLADAFRMATGEKAVTPDHHLFNRTVLRWGALYLPLPWPHGFPTRREIDQLRGGTPPEEFEADRTLVERQIQTIAADPASLEGRPHPLFGSISARAWLRWGWLHTNHHLRQFGA